MNNLKVALLIFFTLGLLASCASWKEQAYQGSAWQIEEIRPIEIPPGFDNSSIEEYYPVPYLKSDSSSEVVINQPPAERINQPLAEHINQPPAKEYYPLPDVVHENMKHSDSGEVPKRL
jgi:uncharacterized lipoprotein